MTVRLQTRVEDRHADEGQRDDGQPEQGSFEAPTEVLLLQELDHVGRPDFVRSSVPFLKIRKNVLALVVDHRCRVWLNKSTGFESPRL